MDNGKEYIGYYFVLANGRVFGGSSSGNSSIELKPYQQGDSYVYSPPSGEVMKYNVLKQINNYSSINKDIPTFTQNLPTEAD
ncbi:MAG: hypothetical protein KC414_08975, partial [Romboutsia sp.]|nr:hypothetical protein [Romboutsia sp.]